MLTALLLLLSVLSGASEADRAANNTVGKVYFKLYCQISHRLKDDPILFPRLPGKSHSHDFFGSTVVNAFTSTTQQLLEGNSSCQPAGAKSGYWVPTLYLLDKKTKRYVPEKPRVITVYYFNRQHGDLRITKSHPQGLRMICGNSTARPQDAPSYILEWFCGEEAGSGNRTRHNNIPKCKGLVMARIYCPSCWDGRRRDSADHRSHMAYINFTTTECPRSHPIRLPEIHITFTYNFTGADWPVGGVRNKKNPPLARLSTIDGGGWQFHTDVWEAWDPATLKNFMEKCYYAGLTCGPDAKDDTRPPPAPLRPPPKRPTPSRSTFID